MAWVRRIVWIAILALMKIEMDLLSAKNVQKANIKMHLATNPVLIATSANTWILWVRSTVWLATRVISKI